MLPLLLALLHTPGSGFDDVGALLCQDCAATLALCLFEISLHEGRRFSGKCHAAELT